MDESGQVSLSGADGKFSIIGSVDANQLTISMIGYQTLKYQVNNSTGNSIYLIPDNAIIDEVVVTALGVQRKAKNLTYSTHEIKGDELTKVKDANPINNLSGKVSGVQINLQTTSPQIQ